MSSYKKRKAIRQGLCVALSVLCILTLAACGGQSDGKESKTPADNQGVAETEQSGDKGTRSNPYQIGETIVVNDFKAYFNNGEKYTDILFNLELTVNKAYTVAEGVAIRKSRYTGFTTIPAASITFTLMGNYDNEMDYCDIFRVGVLDQNMQTDVFTTIEDDNQKRQDTIYTDTTYTVNILHSFDTKTQTGTEAKYFVLYYTGTDDSTKYIYISAEGQETEPADNVAVEPELSAEEKKYQAAVAAEEKGYYTIARNLFGRVLEYKDAQKHYDELNGILQEYTGTYYGESTEYKNVKVYLYVEDGYVTAQFEGQEKSPSKYELYLYGDDNGTPIVAFAPSRTDLFSLNTNTSYDDAVESYALHQLEDGSYLVGATTDSTSYTWNGFYEKISDSVS